MSGPAGRPSPNGQRPSSELAASRPVGFGPGARRGPGGGGFMGMGGMPAGKATNFRKSFRRLLGELRPERTWVLIVVLFAIVSVTLAVIGPKLLGNATNIIFEGVVSKQFPPGASIDQVIALLRAQGQDNLANMLSTMTNLVPGAGIDFTALGQALGVVAVIYIFSSVFAWAQAYIMAGVTQRTVYRLRQRVDQKLGRLPLAYFDRESRGDILSRVTNDIDNISQTLQQTSRS